MKIAFERSAFQDFNEWAQTDRKIYQRIVSLINDIARNPHSGLGKPEPLKHQLQGFWSRRIDQEHRLVYRVQNGECLIVACKYHYR
ncbi:YoeB toxin protein [Methylomonas albis]|uniref:Putative mRNA interferase YoeB n=1 Tax=Methylomonas albis TaxID=1854563 RepID=A0ABR9D8T1_9GAMM|nr:Txe/YoeB family addiction module toxin [Methylomonas albis]MBD9358644.1 Txe/YoeB family addiction module toxin [Methylomonas albis]CAD6882077.1 YoeB toxin protein [Methylomonas albis]